MTNSRHPMPTISVVTPSFNQGAFLEDAIRSVLDQQYPRLHYGIIDGGSDDNSLEIIKKYEQHLHYWVSEPDGGQSEAINKGFAKVDGDVLGWLNSDDRLMPGALQIIGDYFVQHPECQWLVGAGQGVSPKGEIIDTKAPKDISFNGILDWAENSFYQPSVFWRRELLERVGPIREDLEYTMDYELWLRFAEACDGSAIPVLLSKATVHSAAKSEAFDAEQFVEAAFCLYEHGERQRAHDKLSRVVRRAFEVDKRLSLLTRNPIYRRWRDHMEARRRCDD